MKFILFSFLLFDLGCGLIEYREDRQPQRLDVPMSARDDEALRQRVMILPFLSQKGSGPITEEARSFVINELTRSGRVVVLNHQELNLTQTEEYDLESLAKASAPLGASAVIEGKILEIKIRKNRDALGLFRQVRAKVSATIRMRMYSARNGKELFNQTRTAEIEDATTQVAGESDQPVVDDPVVVKNSLREAFSQTFSGLIQSLEKLKWEGRVAMVSGERLFLNAGRLSGLEIGDILKITEDGDEIYDPQNGQFIGKAPGRMKGTVEVISYFGKDGAIAVIHSGSGFKENDRVEMY